MGAFLLGPAVPEVHGPLIVQVVVPYRNKNLEVFFAVLPYFVLDIAKQVGKLYVPLNFAVYRKVARNKQIIGHFVKKLAQGLLRNKAALCQQICARYKLLTVFGIPVPLVVAIVEGIVMCVGDMRYFKLIGFHKPVGCDGAARRHKRQNGSYRAKNQNNRQYSGKITFLCGHLFLLIL